MTGTCDTFKMFRFSAMQSTITAQCYHEFNDCVNNIQFASANSHLILWFEQMILDLQRAE